MPLTIDTPVTTQSPPRQRPLVVETLTQATAEFFAPMQQNGALPPGWKLTGQDTDQGICATFHSPLGGLTVELERVDLQRPCYARSRRFNIYYSTLQREAEKLSASEIALLDAVVRHVRTHEFVFDRDALDDRTPPSQTRVQVREIQVQRMLVAEGPNAYYLNPYVGCLIGCPYCYASHRGDLSRSLQGLPALPWGQWLDVKMNAAAVLAEEIKRLPPGNVRMSPIITDPYQSAERRYEITRQCLEVLLEAGFAPMILTRDALVLRDLPLLRQYPQVKVGLSLGTDDDAVGRAVEPRADLISRRIETLQILKDAGIYTFAMATPILPLNPDRFIELLAPLISVISLGQLFEKPRVATILQQLGRDGPLDERWERDMYAYLREGFTQRGVQVNPRQAPWAYLN